MEPPSGSRTPLPPAIAGGKDRLWGTLRCCDLWPRGGGAAPFTAVQTAADAPPVEATRTEMVRPLLRMYPDTLHLQACSGRRSGQSRASVSACHAQALVCEGRG